MALTFNPFAKKKKDEQIKGGYSSNYTSNPGNSYLTSVVNSLSQGKGLPSVTGQTLSVPSFQQKQEATQNIINKANQPIQGSGYTSNYASNPSNYKSPVADQTKNTNQIQQQQTSVPSYIAGYEDLAAKQKALLEQQRKQGEDYYSKSYAEKNRLLQESIPQLQQQFIKTQGNIQKGIESAAQSAAYKKQNAEDMWGESQRQAAQTRGESEARNRNRFAALGTTSSYGAGSYGQAQENVESDFNRFTQQGLRSKEQNLFEIDKALQDYEIEAQTTLDGLGAVLNNTISQIQSDMTMNNIDKENALNSLFSDYRAKVLSVEEGMQGVYKDYYQALQNAEATSLSDVFMKTGQPQTEADYRYMTENFDAYKDMTSGGQSSTTQEALTLVDELLNADTTGITGIIKTGWIPGTQSALLKNKYDQLKSMLSLENRQALKGSGAISDYEAKVLEKAASALGTNLSDTAFKQVLREMQADLMNVPRSSIQRPSLSSFES